MVRRSVPLAVFLALAGLLLAALVPGSSQAAVTHTAKTITAPPTYMGSKPWSWSCDQQYRTIGFEPVSASTAKHPLFLWFIGSRVFDSDQSARYDAAAALAVTKAMAQRGFYALSVDYEASISPTDIKMICAFDKTKPQNLLTKACALPKVNCNLGIATWGHSQGAALAARAHNFDTRHRASSLTGWSGDNNANISRSRIRLANGQEDPMNNGQGTMNGALSLSCASGNVCNGPNGSGWRRVMKTELAPAGGVAPTADHCWFNQRSCSGAPNLLEPNWSTGNTPFGIAYNADWTQARVAQP